VRCRAHNQLWAEQAFGQEQVEERRRFRQRKSTIEKAHPQGTEPRRKSVIPSESAISSILVEKLRSAMQRMGFRKDEALRAIERMLMEHADESLSVERALRETILIATAA
jgi:hypothetical protein